MKITFSRSLTLLLVATLFLSACSKESEPPAPDLSQPVIEQAKQAVAAANDDEIKAADEALAKAKKLSEQMPAESDTAKSAITEAQDAIALAEEREEVRRLLRKIKPRTYLAGRNTIVRLGVAALSASAKAASTADWEDLPESVRTQAETAAKLARDYAPSAMESMNKTDWNAIASTLENLDLHDAQLHSKMAWIWIAYGDELLAMAEISQADPGLIENPEQRLSLLVVRSVAYKMLGMNGLAQADMAKIESLDDNTTTSHEDIAKAITLIALVHVAHSGNVKKADRMLMQANRLWPNNPVCIFLTGEKLAADGKTEEAAESLEALAAGTKHETIAKMIAERARELRDGKGPQKGLLRDYPLLWRLVKEETKIALNSLNLGETLDKSYNSALALGPKMRDWFAGFMPDADAEAEPVVDRPDAWAKPITDRPGLGNLHKITDNLYRGQQPEPEGFDELKKMGIRTVVNLRTFHSDRDECERVGLDYIHITAQAWEGEDEEVIEFLKVAIDPERQPVFFHCLHGADRTGTMGAAYRMVIQGWTKEEALREMTEGGYGFHAIWQNLIWYLKKMDIEKMRRDLGMSVASAQ